MTAVVVSLVAIVLLVLVVVALGMRSMNRRESSLPPERLKQMIEKEEQTHARSTDEFAAHEPRMANFSPDFSPIDEPKPKPVRTGQRGKRGVDEWGNPRSDDDDEEFWASIRSDAAEGGFGAGGTVAARKGASRPVDGNSESTPDQAAGRPADHPAERQRPAERRRSGRREAAATADPDAVTIQAPLPQRPARTAAPAPTAGLADLVEPAPVQRPAASASDLADQRTVTFAAPTPDVMSILGAGAQPVAPTGRPDPLAAGSRPAPPASVPAAGPVSTGPASAPGTSRRSARRSRSAAAAAAPTAAAPAADPLSTTAPGTLPAGGAFTPAGSGSFPAVPVAPIHGAPTSDPFPAAAHGRGGDPLDSTWTTPVPSATSGSWPAAPVADILDDSAPSGSWPGFEPQQPAATPSRASYEVRPGWAVADDSAPLTGPSPAAGVPTAPTRAVSGRDDVLSAPPASYETGDFTAAPPSQAPWPEPPADTPGWPAYTDAPGAPDHGRARQGDGGRRRAPEHDLPDYYR
ncbi:hypothetical protein FHU36_005886 [Nonomuraea muscovyensis]|uniref:Uncharacterized protein n=1 Tax=Nonomuraea muscovyensis TaxID=1124761 RepID=A0A7X0F1X4_9ACTN|nr:hypothetical protein [Nonomuraea muscovyensis]MBB6349341.1 hypothetical protein [Nonomuraea muscovyensis]